MKRKKTIAYLLAVSMMITTQFGSLGIVNAQTNTRVVQKQNVAKPNGTLENKKNDNVEVGQYNITGDNLQKDIDYTYSDGTLEILSGSKNDMTIEQNVSDANEPIKIDDGYTGNITINNLKFNISSEKEEKTALYVGTGVNLTMICRGKESAIISNDRKTGIENKGVITFKGTMFTSDSVIKNENEINISTTYFNTGSDIINGNDNSNEVAKFTVGKGSTLDNDAQTMVKDVKIINEAGSKFINEGTLTLISVAIENNGRFANESGANIHLTGDTGSCALKNSDGGYIENRGTIDSKGNSTSFVNGKDSQVDNYSPINTNMLEGLENHGKFRTIADTNLDSISKKSYNYNDKITISGYVKLKGLDKYRIDDLPIKNLAEDCKVSVDLVNTNDKNDKIPLGTVPITVDRLSEKGFLFSEEFNLNEKDILEGSHTYNIVAKVEDTNNVDNNQLGFLKGESSEVDGITINRQDDTDIEINHVNVNGNHVNEGNTVDVKKGKKIDVKFNLDKVSNKLHGSNGKVQLVYVNKDNKETKLTDEMTASFDTKNELSYDTSKGIIPTGNSKLKIKYMSTSDLPDNEFTFNINLKPTGGGGGDVTPTDNTSFEQIVGKDRFETADKISDKIGSASTAILTGENAVSDSMTATPFAYQQKAPILLTGKDKLNDMTKAQLKKLGVKKVYVIGGVDVISDSVLNELRSNGISVERIGGEDRFDTSLDIAKKMSGVKQVAIVNGEKGLSDAVSVGAAAAQNNIPIILSNNKNQIPKGIEFVKANGINKTYIIGGTTVISNDLEKTLKNTKRLSGDDRNDTNAAIIDYFYSSPSLRNMFVVKDGTVKETDLIDALAVGMYAAQEKSPVLTVNSKTLSNKQRTVVQKKDFDTITQVGGNGNEKAFEQLKDIFK